MKHAFLIALALTLTFTLSGCHSVQRTLGLSPSAPDEFAVTTHNPLSVPPEFALRPPQDAGLAPTAISEAAPEAAKELLFSDAQRQKAQKSRGERALIANAGGQANDDIRSVLAREYARREKEKSSKVGMLKSLVKWKDEDDPMVDAVAERKRLDKNAEKGLSPAEGETPVLGTGRSSLF